MKLRLFIFMCVIFCASVSNGDENFTQDERANFNEEVYKNYVLLDKQLKSMMEQNVKKLIPYLLEAREHLNITSTCTSNLFNLLNGFRKLKDWSFNFLDALGKIPSGIQTGNTQMFGEYEECVETTVKKKGIIDFKGQYCLIVLKPYLPKVDRIPGFNDEIEGLVNATTNTSDVIKMFTSKAQVFFAMKIRFGLCIPSGCTKEDVSDIVKYSIGNYMNATVSHCLKEGDLYFWTKTRIVIVFILTIFGAIVVASTLLDNTLASWKSKKLDFKSRIFQCFSLTRNFPKLMDTNVTENCITCLNGIRVLTIFWIILGHEYFFIAVSLTANHFYNYEKILSQFFSQIVLNGFVAVDIFFFLSGFVNSYMRVHIKQRGSSQPSVFKIITHRLWRIYPAYIVAFLLAYLLCAPYAHHYPEEKKYLRNCDLYWWRNLLFINNFFKTGDMCLPQTWFLSADMQLFLLSLFTIPVILKNTKKGIILHVAIILLVNLCSMTWWFVDDLGPSTLDATRLDLDMTLKNYRVYVNPVVHVGPYFIGIILGCVVATAKEIKIPKVTKFFGWIAASLCFISMLFMTLRWNSGISYTTLESSLYGAWSRTIMVLGFSWLVLCCATGNAALFNYILSLKMWIPLSRITYMIYLLSPLVQYHYDFHQSLPKDFSVINIIWIYFADVTISILMSFAAVLLFESPLISMEKILFKREEDTEKSSNNNMQEEKTVNNLKDIELQQNGKNITIHL